MKIRNMLRVFWPGLALLAAQAVFASAFLVSVDTSVLSGTQGGIYFQFDPGLNADPASVAIDSLTLGSPGAIPPLPDPNIQTLGAVTGNLVMNDLVLENTFAANYYVQDLTFGPTLRFEVLLTEPTSFTGSSGSELEVQLTGSDLLTPLLSSDPSGNLLSIAYDNTGAITVDTFYAGATITNAVPEPTSGSVILVMMACLLMRRVWFKRFGAVLKSRFLSGDY